MNSVADFEDRIARGIAAASVDTDEIIPFPKGWGRGDLAHSLSKGAIKDEVFRLLNADWRLTLYRYRSVTGAVMLIILRLDAPDGSGKFVRPLRVQRQIGCRFEVVARGLEPLRPLYGLERLAAAPEAAVLLVEGEKAADAGQLLFPELVAVTWCGGASGAAQADWLPLAGRNVFLWPDNDSAGVTGIREVAKALGHVGARAIRLVENPAWFPPKWDIADPLPIRHNG
jgi:hypothetical protein